MSKKYPTADKNFSEYHYNKNEFNLDFAAYGKWQDLYSNLLNQVYTEYFKYIQWANERNNLNHVIPENPIFLDYGCACGATCYGVAKNHKTFSKVYGLDIDEEMLSIGKNKFKHDSMELFKQEPDKELPFDDNSIALIHCQQVFEHIPIENIPYILKEIKRVLHPYGIFLNFPSAVKFWEKPEDRMHVITRITLLTEPQWLKLFKQYGFYVNHFVKGLFMTNPIIVPPHNANFARAFFDDWTIFCLQKDSI